MDIKDTFGKIVSVINKWLKIVGLFLWTIIRAVATVITFLIIFALLSLIMPFKFIWVLSLGLLLWFVYANRQKVGAVIAVLIAFMLALMLFNAFKFSFLPEWLIKKSSLVFEFNLSGKNFGSKNIKDKELDNLNCEGSADLYNVSVKRAVKVDGQLTASLLKAQGKVEVDGSANLNDINLKSDLVVDGSLYLNKGIISGAIKVDGSANLNDIECKKGLFIDGSLTLNKGVILGKIFVDGSASLNDLDLKNSLTVDGSLNINKGIILGKTFVDGSADINESKIRDLIVSGERTNIGSSIVKTIRVKKLSESAIEIEKKQVVKLTKSQVEGNIVFDSGLGEVILEGGSSVGGKIIGGKVIKS